ncbi:MAG: phosphonate transport system permease protein [Planctomycetota bacterium]|jgi:phosphonate transport system permease protein
MTRPLDRAPFPISRRGFVLIAISVLGIYAFLALELTPGGLTPGAGGIQIAREFFSAALSPSFEYEAEFVPAGAQPFLSRVFDAVRRTVVFAAAGMSIALVGGLLLGLLASSSTWSTDRSTRGSVLSNVARSSIGRGIQAATRLLIAGMRSIHELLWAVIFLAAFGLNTASAVIAIAIPFAGVLAKVFSELLDEAPDHAAFALRATGASRLQSIIFGRVPAALPDMAAYSFYRLECAVRSSAVLGFFGFETLGYYIKASFENLHYREVWTYLYALLIVVLVFEFWSAALRKRFTV